MLLTDPVTLLLIVIPLGLMTTLLLCLSYVGLGTGNRSLHWWIAGDLLLAVYRTVLLLQPGVPRGDLAGFGVVPPAVAFVAATGLLALAICAHTLALYHLADRARGTGWQLRVWLLVPLAYVAGAVVGLREAWLVPWFAFSMVLAIGMQWRVTWLLTRRYRGAWGLLAGQAVVLSFPAWTALQLALHPLPPLPFDTPDLPTLTALAMDFLVSFLFTLSYALMLQEQLRQQIQHLGNTDSLTGALNRRGALPLLRRTWDEAVTRGEPMAVAMIDLDHFKRLNDQHGHAAGDAALQAFASQVMRLKRRADLLVRWGGEEFLLVLPQADAGQALGVLRRLRETLDSPVAGSPEPLRFSAGLADSRTPGLPDFESVLRAVDKALYRAKARRDHVERVGDGDR